MGVGLPVPVAHGLLREEVGHVAAEVTLHGLHPHREGIFQVCREQAVRDGEVGDGGERRVPVRVDLRHLEAVVELVGGDELRQVLVHPVRERLLLGEEPVEVVAVVFEDFTQGVRGDEPVPCALVLDIVVPRLHRPLARGVAVRFHREGVGEVGDGAVAARGADAPVHVAGRLGKRRGAGEILFPHGMPPSFLVLMPVCCVTCILSFSPSAPRHRASPRPHAPGRQRPSRRHRPARSQGRSRGRRQGSPRRTRRGGRPS